MPAVVRKRGKGWVVLSHEGKGERELGRHGSRAQAARQARAVNARMAKWRRWCGRGWRGTVLYGTVQGPGGREVADGGKDAG